MSRRPSQNDVSLVYDGQCPVCRYYARKTDVSPDRLVRIDARGESEPLAAVTRAGLDIDEGMALLVGDSIYFGSDALHQLALNSSGKGAFNRTMAAIFRRPRLARVVYPVMVACRKLLLKLLRRSRIDNLALAARDKN